MEQKFKNKIKEQRALVAEFFIENIDKSGLKWNRQFNLVSHISYCTNKEYNGINQFSLGRRNEKSDYRWMTMAQIKNKDFRLSKGSKGEMVFYYIPYDKVEKKYITWSEYESLKTNERAIFPKQYFVFNCDDVVGVEPMKVVIKNYDVGKDLKTIIEKMGIAVSNGNSIPHYNPSEDKIVCNQNTNNEQAYYAILLHELAHSTGAKHRLDRKIANKFGSEAYAYEELVAEITSAFMYNHIFGTNEIDKSMMDNHLAYLQSWKQAIKKDNSYLFNAIKDAEKASNYMLRFLDHNIEDYDYSNDIE